MADDIKIGPCDGRDPVLASAIRELDLEGFAYGHKFFDTGKVAVLRANPIPSHGGPWDARWMHLLPSVVQHFCAFQSGLLIGHMMVFEDYPPGQYAVVEPMNVRPGNERQGIGKRMWACVKQTLKDHPYRSRGLRLWVVRKNRNALDFYLGVGCWPLNSSEQHAFRIGDQSEEAVELRYDFPDATTGAAS